MRWKLLRRRLGISAPRMIVRSHLPWPVRWALMALVLGFAAALGLWAFDFGKGLAGVDSRSNEELQKLRNEVTELKAERDKLASGSNTAESRLKTERAAQASLAAQVQTLEAENGKLKDDIRFFERLIPTNAQQQDISIRSLQAESILAVRPNASQPATKPALKFRMLVIQTGKNAPEFVGRVDLQLLGTKGGAPWQMTLPDEKDQNTAAYRLSFKGYQRVEGEIPLPADAVVQSIRARVMDKNGTRATQVQKLGA